jgi:hypothetical protein
MPSRRIAALRLLMIFSIAASLCAAQQPFPGEPAQPQPSQPRQQAQPFPGEPPSQQQNQPPQQQKQSRPFTPQDFPPDPNADMPTFRVSTSVVIVPTLVEKANG